MNLHKNVRTRSVALVASNNTLTIIGTNGPDSASIPNPAGDTNKLQVDFAGAGNGNGKDVIFGQAGNDTIDGQVGHDTEFLGAGADTAMWNPGEGSDVIDGGNGTTPGGPGDGAADLVTIDGTGDNAHLTVHSHDTRVDGKGMTAKSSISGAETIDKLRINCRGGDDKVAVAHHVSTILGVDVNLGSAN